MAFVFAGILLASRPESFDPLLIVNVLERENACLDDPVRVRGWIRELPEELEDADRFVLESESIFADTPARGGFRVTVYRPPGGSRLRLPYGRRVEFLARLRHLRNFETPGSFDRVHYLQRQGIYMTASVRPGVPLLELEGEGGVFWRAWTWNARASARERLEALVSEDAETRSPGSSILRAMILGARSSLDRETKTDFQRTGVYHVLVISGLHVGVLAFVLLSLLRMFFASPFPRAIITTILIGVYAMVVGASLPVSRATWMLAAYLAASLVYRQRQALNIIAGTAFVFLVCDPELLFDVGFQMSFLSVALIAGIAGPLLRTALDPYRLALVDVWNQDLDLHLVPQAAQHRVALRRWLEALKGATGLPQWFITLSITGALRVLTWAAGLVLVSLVIQIGLALPMAAHFHRFSWAGVSANLLVMPLLLVAVPAGLLAMMSGSAWIAGLALAAANAIGAVVEWHAQYLPVDIRVPPPPLWLGVLFGVALGLVALSFGRTARWRWTAAVTMTVSFALLVQHPFPKEYRPGHLELSALDVGQGESLFLALPDGKTMLIDGGGLPDYGGKFRPTLDIGEAVVSPYLWSRSIKRLDVVAVSHPDADHFAGIPAVLDNFAVGELWLAADCFADEYRDLVRSLSGRGLRTVPLRHGEVRWLGDVQFEVLGPGACQPDQSSRNDESLVLRARFGRQSFLLTGDIEQRGESRLVSENLLPGDAVLKVPHHGSKTSSRDPFLARVSPTFAIISAGYRSPFGHPHPEVLERLRRYRAKVLRTDLEGVVTVYTDGQRLDVSTHRRERSKRAPWAVDEFCASQSGR